MEAIYRRAERRVDAGVIRAVQYVGGQQRGDPGYLVGPEDAVLVEPVAGVVEQVRVVGGATVSP